MNLFIHTDVVDLDVREATFTQWSLLQDKEAPLAQVTPVELRDYTLRQGAPPINEGKRRETTKRNLIGNRSHPLMSSLTPTTIKLSFYSLPVELIADIFSELDLETLCVLSTVSKRFRNVVSDSSLNPWRRPILRALRSEDYGSFLRTLSVRSTAPRHNWIEILSLALPTFILYEATLPNLSSDEWEECFNRRFLPGWRKWKKGGSWRKAYLKLVRHKSYVPTPETYTRLLHPLPALSHANYPFYTPGGCDKRWLGEGEVEEEGLRWVGGLMYA
ncbi:hypothetical protein C0991_003569 [Blastosporella zonata]|nr:hypothetical protein C0991_003569 [Blastosporella zonata]